jgi:hypothetical protein
MASASRSKVTSFSRKPRAPARTPSKRASSSSKVVRRIVGGSASR